jgi:hypothetical protein
MKFSGMSKAELLKLIRVEPPKREPAFYTWRVEGLGTAVHECDPQKLTAAEIRDWLQHNANMARLSKVHRDAVQQEGQEHNAAAWRVLKAAVTMEVEQRAKQSRHGINAKRQATYPQQGENSRPRSYAICGLASLTTCASTTPGRRYRLLRTGSLNT